MNVVIFSREIHSGKTTELFHWVNERKNISGILMPDQNGQRMFYDITEKKYFPAQAVAGQASPVISVGSFVFDAAAFQKANAILQKAMTADTLIVVDEIGKLEMEDKGFGKILKELLSAHCRLLLVIRDDLLETAINKFNLHQARIIHSMQHY